MPINKMSLFPPSHSSYSINSTHKILVTVSHYSSKTIYHLTNYRNLLLHKINCGLHILSPESNYETTKSDEKIRHHTPASTPNFSYHLETVAPHRNRSQATTRTNKMSKIPYNSLAIQKTRNPPIHTNPFHYSTLYILLLSKSLYSQKSLN
uniref:Uncharacterized protein n=1 Tax=Corethron hystrix TaxID=216773 RepID=A0A7S1B4H9_9STRA